MTKILLNGYNGRMGKVIIDLVRKNGGCEVVAGIDLLPASGEVGFPVYTDIRDCCVPADVIIDFSLPQAIPGLLEYAVEKQIPVVLCTTGLDAAALALVEQASAKVAILKSANMSVGINLIAALLSKMVQVLEDSGFDIEIIEKHHNQKLDAPSGTALYLADSINKASGNRYEYVYDRSKQNVERDKNELGIHTVRGGTIVGDHSVLFAGRDEVIEISHSAASKEVFAVGAVKAARFMAGKPAGLYDMSDVMSEI